MQERFKQLLEEKNLTATRFAAMIKVNASAMSHILNGRSKPGFEVLDKIAQAFPDVNLNWLISGKGSLYNSQIQQNPTPIQSQPSRSLQEEKKDIIENKTFENISQTSLSPNEALNPVVPISSAKKIKRIILFFEDGSFEDYEE